MPKQTVENISYRAKRITRQINSDFRGIDSDSQYSLFVGSYGRGTEIHTSDIDIIIQLPYSTYQRYNSYQSNGQSALLQGVRDSLKKTYATTHLSGDGQVVKLAFNDDICFEIVPAFINQDGKSYTYPDTNNGGSWKTTDPKSEISEMTSANILWNKNLKRLCRMARAWKDQWDIPISGLLIDTLSYNFLRSWQYRDKSFTYYDWMTRDFFEFIKNQKSTQNYWIAPGSAQYVWRKGTFEYKALQCHNLAIEAIKYEEKNMPYTADDYWRKIYGNKF
ncbi:TPA: nucleotidyltransferase [Legionella pneumophila subsp. pneumophila]|nr:nucleotidyltransferase [Legionella pneumophila]HAT9352093.1 nucleotidyltransferase [Legionella pneumophila subsp. pneumophila]HAT9367918.1 nucleotidyltransferase [Legionella pneumophila subsp. pneumophila]